MQDQLDPTVVNLAKAIRQTESGGDFTAKGKSGEHGGYQFTPDTWNATASKYGINVPIEQATPEQQNAVAYNKIKSWKDAGHDVTQIASMWNAGEAEPNAYTGKFGTTTKTHNAGDPSTGVNKFGAKYDVPSYAKSVAGAYLTLKNGGQVQADANNPSSVANPQNQPEQGSGRGFLGDIAHSIAEPVLTTLARPIQAGAELLGASAEDVNKSTKDIAGDWVAPVPQNANDAWKDVGRAAQTVAMGLPVGTIGGAIKAGAVMGGGAGLEQTGTVGGTATGALTGGVLGLGGGLASKALETLPMSLTKSAFKDLTPAQAEKFLNEKSIGTKAGLLEQSQKSVASQGEIIKNTIKAADDAGVRGAGNDSLRKTLLDYPEYANDKALPKMFSKLKALIKGTPDVGGRGEIISAMDKIANGTATLAEKNMVRSALDQATSGSYAKMARNLNPSAGHEMAMKFANNLRSEVQNWVPDTIPLFQEQAKEMAIQNALNKLVHKTPESFIGYKEIMPFLGVNAFGGAGAGLGAAALEKAARSSAVKFGAAKGIRALGNVVKPVTSRAGLLAPAIIH